MHLHHFVQKKCVPKILPMKQISSHVNINIFLLLTQVLNHVRDEGVRGKVIKLTTVGFLTLCLEIYSFSVRRGWRSTLPTPGADQSSCSLQAAWQVHPKVTGKDRGSCFSQVHQPENPLGDG